MLILYSLREYYVLKNIWSFVETKSIMSVAGTTAEAWESANDCVCEKRRFVSKANYLFWIFVCVYYVCSALYVKSSAYEKHLEFAMPSHSTISSTIYKYNIWKLISATLNTIIMITINNMVTDETPTTAFSYKIRTPDRNTRASSVWARRVYVECVTRTYIYTLYYIRYLYAG